MYNKKVAAYFFIIPFILFTAVFILYPSIINIINSAYKFRHKLDSTPEFIGWGNVTWLFRDKDFWLALKNTAILITLVIVLQVGIALALALLINHLSRRVSSIFRVVYFMPIVVSATAIGTMYILFIQPEGLFTKLIGKDSFNWLPVNSTLSLFVVLAPVIWQYIGFYFVIMITGLASIPEHYQEAARIDGASGIKIIFKITLPMMWNVFRTCVVLAITGALKVFDLPHTVAPLGAPGRQTILMGTYNHYLYNGNRLGQSAVYSLFIVAVGVIVSLISNSVLRENKDLVL